MGVFYLVSLVINALYLSNPTIIWSQNHCPYPNLFVSKVEFLIASVCGFIMFTYPEYILVINSLKKSMFEMFNFNKHLD